MANHGESPIRFFEMKASDLAGLVTGTFDLKPHAQSVLEPLCRAAQPVSDEAGRLSGDPALRKALGILSMPDHTMRIRIGGGAMGFEEATLCHAAAQGQPLALFGGTDDGNRLVALFADAATFVDWWTAQYGGKNADTVPNPVPPKTTLGEFLMVLHAIDSFRRVSYENMLAYVSAAEPVISLKQYLETFSAAIRSRDIRWLLPAFLALTPGVETYPAELKADNAQILVRLGLAAFVGHPKTGEGMLAFSGNLRSIGSAFFRSWMFAAGFEILSVSTAGRQAYGSFFLAPTALANHFVRLETDASGATLANHQTYTASQLRDRMLGLLQEMTALPAPAAAAAAPVSSAPTAAAAAPVSSAPAAPVAPPSPENGKASAAYCHKCGNPLRPEERFCVSCGTPRAEKKG